MMKPSEQTCDIGRIDEYLEERLSNNLRDSFEEHLTSCDFCQIELQRRAAEPEIWRDAVELLGHQVDSGSGLAAQTTAGLREQRAKQILETLGPTDAPEMLGRIDDYEISGIVGVGGMGAVLKGFDRSLRRVVAIKVMAPHLAHSGSARVRFQREARAAAAITHDNVIDTYGVSEANGLPYLVMPFARGPSLQRRIDESGPLTTLEVIRIGRQIASGLAAAHDQGLIHRDIKPANILLNEGIERLWITDFGVARAMDDVSMTQTGVIAGTPQYMSPEQARGESVDPRSDLFSMGSVLYTACTGRPPFRAEAAYGILRRITDTEPRSIRELNPEIPEWLCRIIERLMSKNVADRFTNAAAVEALFEDCIAYLQQPSRAELPPTLADLGRPDRYDRSEREAKEEPKQPVANRQAIGPNGRRRLFTLIAAAGSVALALLAWAATDPPDIAGHWAGESWPSVTLSTVENAKGWYSGSFVDEKERRGAIQLEWSRLQRRYSGRWKVGDGAAGSLTLRTVGNDIRGAVAIDADSTPQTNQPRLRDFLWNRGPAPTETTNAASLKKSTNKPPPALVIECPVKGRIVRWGDGVQDGARVKKGTVIAEVRDIDTRRIDMFEEERAAARNAVEASEANVVAQKKNLEFLEALVVSHESQFAAYEETKKQLKAAVDARVAAAVKKVDAANALLKEQQAALKQDEKSHTRNKDLFEEKILSEVKLQLSERTIVERKARIENAKAEVGAAETAVGQIKADEKTKEQQAIIDAEKARVELLKAQADLAKGFSEHADAENSLIKAKKELLEAETKLARQESVLIKAPVTGVISRLFSSSSTRVVEQGDVICVLQPEVENTSADQRSEAVDRAELNDSRDAETKGFDTRDLVNILGRSAEALSVADTIKTAVSLGERYRSIHARLKSDTSKNQNDDSPASEEMVVANRDRETAVGMLTVEREAVARQNETQVARQQATRHRIETGDLDPASIYQHDLDVLTSGDALQRLDLLLGYYKDVDNHAATTEWDAKLAADILRSYRDAAEKRHQILSKLAEIERRKFQLGYSDTLSVTGAEQAEAAASAELKTADALLNRISTSPIGPTEEQ